MEVLYSQDMLERYEDRTKIKDIFNMDLDFTIDIDQIIRVEQMWERYHNNTNWCYFGIPKTDEELVEDGMYGRPPHKYKIFGPMFKIDIDLFRKALYYERNNISYEFYLEFAIKYIHVRLKKSPIQVAAEKEVEWMK